MTQDDSRKTQDDSRMTQYDSRMNKDDSRMTQDIMLCSLLAPPSGAISTTPWGNKHHLLVVG